MNRTRKTLTGLLLLFVLLPLAAQGQADTVYTFRFVPADDMFYVPYADNEAGLARLEKCVALCRQGILDGEIPLYVDGHAGEHAIAGKRSNRVKSELIIRQGLKEENFVTRNRADGGDIPTQTTTAPGKEYALSLRANLLRWATLTPDLGLEWRVSRSWGILVYGSWTSWSWSGKDRRYALWEVSPEVRYYIGKEKRGYIGAMYKAGAFNYKLSGTGRQGDLMGGGIIGGYRLRLNDALSLDFSLAVGCLHADYDKYVVTDGVRVRAGKEAKNRWGPMNAGVTLAWKLF